MKIKTTLLQKGLKRLAAIPAKNPILPEFGNITFIGDGENLELLASDGDILARLKIGEYDGESFSYSIQPSTNKIIMSLKDDEIEFLSEIGKDGEIVTVRAGAVTHCFLNGNVLEGSVIPKLGKDSICWGIDGKEFKKDIGDALLFVSSDNLRPQQTCIGIERDYIAATDCQKFYIKGEFEGNVCHVKGQDLKKALKALGSGELVFDYEMGKNGGRWEIRQGDNFLVRGLCDMYPDHQHASLQGFSESTSKVGELTSSKKAIDCLKLACQSANMTTYQVVVTDKEIRAYDLDFDKSIKIGFEMGFEGAFKQAFNAKLLESCLSVVGDGCNIELEGGKDNSLIGFRDGDLYVGCVPSVMYDEAEDIEQEATA